MGGGSNAIGIFHAFLADEDVALHGYEAGGDGVETGRHAATITGGSIGVLHGTRSYLLQDARARRSSPTRSPPAWTTPESARSTPTSSQIGRADYHPVTDTQAMEAFALLCRTEGIIPAIESAHALAGALDLGRELGPDGLVLVNLSGRGDKDVSTAARWFGIDLDEDPAVTTLRRSSTRPVLRAALP